MLSNLPAKNPLATYSPDEIHFDVPDELPTIAAYRR